MQALNQHRSLGIFFQSHFETWTPTDKRLEEKKRLTHPSEIARRETFSAVYPHRKAAHFFASAASCTVQSAPSHSYARPPTKPPQDFLSFLLPLKTEEAVEEEEKVPELKRASELESRSSIHRPGRSEGVKLAGGKRAKLIPQPVGLCLTIS